MSIPTYTMYAGELIDVASVFGLGWLFRGQPDATWDIASSFEREVLRLRNKESHEFEAHALKEIKLAVSYPECRDMEGSDDFSWLAFLQHHGCKTRLVDFTDSFYVALFFALRDLPAECEEDFEQDAVIWAIKKSPLESGVAVLAEKNKWDGITDELARRLINNAVELHWRYENSEDRALAVVVAKPTRLNQRLIAQQGLFLAPLNLKFSFMENLAKCLDLEESVPLAREMVKSSDLEEAEPNLKVLKIVIPMSEHRKLLFHLKRMNITEATLFPGLDGFARSLNYYAVGMELAP